MSTNAPYKPSYEGELAVFQSPHACDVLLVDRAEMNKYGILTWAAVDLDDPVAISAIADHQATFLLPALRRALKNPPKIVLAYCDGSLLSSVDGNGSVQAIQGSSPAGGNSNGNGWWSNGIYLCYGKIAVALRDNVKKVLLVNSQHLEAFRKSWVVVGLEVEQVEHFQ